MFVLEEDFYPGEWVKFMQFIWFNFFFVFFFQFADTWKDDQKMSVFLYHFRPRQVNPEHYDQKMKFWRDLIENYCGK